MGSDTSGSDTRTAGDTSTVEVIDLAAERASRVSPAEVGPGVDQLVLDAATLLNSTLEPQEVLRRLADLALRASGAQRASLFLLDGRLLRPTVAIGVDSDEDLWAAFQGMGPVRLADVPLGAERLARASAIPIPDAEGSDLVPQRWVRRFTLRSLVLVPLRVGDEPCGLLAVDYDRRREFTADELRPLEALGACAGVAVRNARLYDAARRRATIAEALAKGAAALVSTEETRQTVGVLADAFADLTGADLCVIGLFDAELDRITTLATRGGSPSTDAIPLTDVPPRIVDRLTTEWSEHPRRPVAFGDDRWFATVAGREPTCQEHLVVPLTAEDRPRGAVVLGFADRAPVERELRRAIRDLAALASLTLERATFLDRLDRHGRQMEALYTISTALLEGADATVMTERLNGLLTPEGVEVVTLAWEAEDLVERIGGERITDVEREAWRTDHTACVEVGDDLSVPMRIGDEVLGGLRVRPSDIDTEARTFVAAVAHGVAEVAQRGMLRATLEDAARERAIATERDRIAADLHETVGQLFIAVGLLLNRIVEHLPSDSRWVAKLERAIELTDSGKWEIDQAVRALAFVPSPDRRLPAALRALAGSFQSDSGITTIADITHAGPPLTAPLERALYRVTHEALSNAWRHARCAVVRVSLDVTEERVELRVRDDGVGLPPRRPGRPLDGVGIASMRRVLKELGGELELETAHPHGTSVTARIPRRPT